MMKKLNVQAQTSTYPIYIHNSYTDSNPEQGLSAAFASAGLEGRKVCIVTDSNVCGLYLETVRGIIDSFASEVCCCIFDAGEAQKNLDTIQQFYRIFLENRMDRKSVVVALGGGVTGDMAGFAAASYMRGIAYVHLPTTLLAQVDSSVGGKVGVDFMGHKNMVGAFYQPAFVYINTNTLLTLPPEQFSSGIGEVIKHGLIMDEQYYQYIVDQKENIRRLDSNAIEKIVYGSCKIKSLVVSEDEKEQGKREILNFGHTFGHAIESLADFLIPHGHCVACGMVAALRVSHLLGNISADRLSQALSLFEWFDLPIQVAFSPGDIYKRMFMDKKAKDNQITYVLIDRIGQAYRTRDVQTDIIMEGIQSICM